MSKVFALALVLVFLTASFIIVPKPVSGEAVAEDSWSTVASIPMQLQYNDILVASATSGEIYVLGYDFAECYTAETNNWTAITSPPNYQGYQNYDSTSVAYQSELLAPYGASIPN